MKKHKLTFNIKKHSLPLLSLLLVSALMAGCGNSKEASSETGFYFNTMVSVTFYGDDKQYLDGAMEICAKYNQMLDRHTEGTLVSDLNKDKSATGCEELIDIIKTAEEYSVDGKFDITVAPILDLWGFSGDDPAVPDADELSKLLSKERGYTYDEDAGTVTLTPDTELDFGGIAKGYAADRISDYCSENGIENALISLSNSSIVLVGTKPDGSDFKIGLQTPFAASGTYEYTLTAHDCSISTSGSFERYFEEDGKIYHQLIDPDTGCPASSGLNSVTVITDGAAKADVISTELFIMGYDAAMEYVESHDGIEAIFMDTDNKIYVSDGLTIDGTAISFK